MTTNECVSGKVTETNLVHRNTENLEKKNNNNKKGKKWNAKKDSILKYVKCQWEEMITCKNKLVKIFKAKMKC